MSGELATLRIMVMVLSGGTFHLKRPNIWYSKLSKEGRSRTVSILSRREAQGLLESGLRNDIARAREPYREESYK